jgi:hypothetical protein
MQTYQITQTITRIAFVEATNEEDAKLLAENLSDFDYDTDNIDEIMELLPE